MCNTAAAHVADFVENPSLHTRAFSSNGELIAFLETYLKKNDVVLIKGSNGMNLKEVSKALMA